MASAASQADLEFLLDLANEYQADYPATRALSSGSFEWLRLLAPGTMGSVARHLVVEWATHLGLNARLETVNHQHYVVVNGSRIQVKLSTLWESGTFKFQQIRDQDYDYVFCLGLAPTDVHAWLVPKDEMLTHLAGVGGQHTGSMASETHWITLNPGANFPWIDEWGHQLSDVREILRSL